MRTKLRNLLVLLICIISFVACDGRKVSESLCPINDMGWKADSSATFDITATDTQQSYNLLVLVRNTNDFPYSNLWLYIKCQSPSGKVVNDTIECVMADKDGKWVGRGWGDQYYVHFPYRPDFRFTENGDYHFEIQQGMRTQDLKGIHDIGLRLEKTK